MILYNNQIACINEDEKGINLRIEDCGHEADYPDTVL